MPQHPPPLFDIAFSGVRHMSEIYRKSSLERLSSPEQLDKMIKVTSPLSWLTLLGAVVIIVAVIIWSVFGRLPQKVDISGVFISSNRIVTLNAPIRGVIKNMYAAVGDSVKSGDTIVSIADSNGSSGSSGSSGSIKAISSGILTSINYHIGDFVFPTDEIAKLMIINEEGLTSTNEMEILCYVPISVGKNLKTGMDVMVAPDNISEQEFGNLIGTVKSISGDIISTNEMMTRLGSEILASTFQQQGPVLEVVVKLEEDEGTESGFMWSNKNGDNVIITSGTMITARVIIKSEAPIVKLLPFLKSSIH